MILSRLYMIVIMFVHDSYHGQAVYFNPYISELVCTLSQWFLNLLVSQHIQQPLTSE